MVIFVRGRMVPEHRNPINRVLIWIYRPVIRAVMRAKMLVILVGARQSLAVNDLAGASARHRVHAEPERRHVALYADDAAGYFGHQGRRTAADPGPIIKGRFRRSPPYTARPGVPRLRPIRRRSEMFETVVNLKPKEQWRPGSQSTA